jgi:hypothetical protein
MMRLYLIILFVVFSVDIYAQEVTGIVFIDENQNGVLDSTEGRLPNVSVTNGVDVVVTDQEGKYVLPVEDDNIIAVIKPSGFGYSVNEYNLPQFYYIHKPNGSPELKFPGVAPTGKLPKEINFGLIPQKDSEEFSALIFGDPQPYTIEEVGFFDEGIVSELEDSKNYEFGISLGDLVGNDLDLFNPYKKAVKKIGVPWYNVLGNHDLNFDVEEDHLSDETFEDHFGPANYAFNYGKVHFIVLDDILYPDPRDQKGYWGGFRPDQLEFIENDLKHVPKDHLIVLAFHIPLTEPNADNFRDEDRKMLFELLKDFPHTLSLSAHTHIQKQEFLGEEYDWLQNKPHHHYNVGTTSGDWYSGKLDDDGVPFATMRDGTPKGYAIISFEGNQYQIRYKVAGKPADYQMEIFAPKVVANNRGTKAGIYVNFFMGGENDEVLYRIDDGDWKPMKYLEDYDPSYVRDVMEWDLSEELMPGRRSSNPMKSSHLWRAGIPVNLGEGEHIIEVKATDMYGNSFTQSKSYRLEAPE